MRAVLPPLLLCMLPGLANAGNPASPPTTSEILAASPDSDWTEIPAENLMIVQLDSGTVLIELAPDFAPKNVANIRTLVLEDYFDGLAIVRSHDNYVVQWADPKVDTDEARPLGTAKAKVKGEYDRPAAALSLRPLPSPDAYADTIGFVDGFPAGSDGERTWMAHCYGTVGVARGMASDSGNGTSLYVVTGHAPRHLDANITLAGRVIDGIEHLSALPRGSGALGFYTQGEPTTPILNVQLASQIPEPTRPRWERLNTDSATFEAVIDSKKNRRNPWFAHPVGRIGLCNVPLPRRERTTEK